MTEVSDLNVRNVCWRGRPIRDATLLEERTTESSDDRVTFSFSDLDADTRYLLEYRANNANGDGPTTLRCNGDAAGDDHYVWYDETATKHENADAFVLVDPTNPWCDHAGTVHVSTRGSHVGLDHTAVTVRHERMNTFGRNALYSEGPLSSLQFSIDGWSGGSGGHLRLWEIHEPTGFGPEISGGESWDHVGQYPRE